MRLLVTAVIVSFSSLSVLAINDLILAQKKIKQLEIKVATAETELSLAKSDFQSTLDKLEKDKNVHEETLRFFMYSCTEGYPIQLASSKFKCYKLQRL